MAELGSLRRLGTGAFIYGAGGFLSRFISLLILPLFTAYLTPTDYGITGLLGMVSMVVVSVFSLGLGTSLGICYFQESTAEKRGAAIWTAFGILGLSAAALAVLGTQTAEAISQLALGTTQYPHLVTLTLLTACLSIAAQPLMLCLQFEERARTYVSLTMLTTLFTLGISIWMVVFLRGGVEGVLWAGLLGQALNLIVFLAAAIRIARFRVDPRIAMELLRLGLPMVPSFAFLFLLSQANRYVLQWFAGLSPVGIYSIGLNFGMVMNIAVSGFQTAWLPYFLSFSDKRDEARILFGRIMTYYVLGLGGASLLFFIGAKPLVMLMTAPAFHQAYQVVGLAATAQVLAGVFSVLLPAVYFAKEVASVTIVQGIASLLAIILSIPLIAFFGLFGAALSLPLGYAIMAGMQYGWNVRRRDAYLQVVYDWARIGRFALVYVAFGALTLVPRSLSLPVELLLSMASGGLLLVCCERMLTKGEKQALLGMLRPWIPANWPRTGPRTSE